MPRPADLSLRVLVHEALDDQHHLLTLEAEGPIGDFAPGQFVMVRCGEALTLRRPFSIQRRTDAGARCAVEILYRVVGEGTAELTHLAAGDEVVVLGPLGRSFDLPQDGERPVLLGGGVGIPPMVALAEAILADGLAQPILVGGVGGSADSAPLQGLRAVDAALNVATMDGSEGTHGTVLDALRRIWTTPPAGTRLYACGPMPMLAAVARLALEHHLPCQVSMEAVMGCGFGACVGCAVPRAPRLVEAGQTRYTLVCQEGPVFDAQALDWDVLERMS